MKVDWTSIRVPRLLVERLKALGALRHRAYAAGIKGTEDVNPDGTAVHETIAWLLDQDDAHRERARAAQAARTARGKRERRGCTSPE